MSFVEGVGHRGLNPLNKFEKLSWRPSVRDPGHCAPPARSGHRCVADNANLYVFGGYNPDFEEAGGSENEDYPLFRELWRFHFATATWQQLRTEGYMPTELASMSVVLHGNNLLVFGGTGIPFGESNGNDVHVCNIHYKRTDLHRLDLSTRVWVHLKPKNAPIDLPEERSYRHELAHDRQRIYILGGGTSWTSYPLDKIHAYNLETNYWERIATKPHEKIGYPAARRCHSCVQVKDEVFICGGYNGEQILPDLWKINLQTYQWSRLPALMPEPAYFHCAAITPAGCMYVHGGVVNMPENQRTGSLYKVWLVVPSLLELAWERLLKAYPRLPQLSTPQLHSLGLAHTFIQRLK
ncbi:hypothetical protein CRUP_031152 [Coryphaenoides rupestris]|nr:hypothetical protein CRUP_031152 [Coryphaenoides rupestris]